MCFIARCNAVLYVIVKYVHLSRPRHTCHVWFFIDKRCWRVRYCCNYKCWHFTCLISYRMKLIDGLPEWMNEKYIRFAFIWQNRPKSPQYTVRYTVPYKFAWKWNIQFIPQTDIVHSDCSINSWAGHIGIYGLLTAKKKKKLGLKKK